MLVCWVSPWARTDGTAIIDAAAAAYVAQRISRRLAWSGEAAAQAAAGGGARARDRHLARGKMLPRDRVANLLDPGSPFLEVGRVAAHGMYDGAAPAAGAIAGVGRSWGARSWSSATTPP
jgi:3-methylcrotonyl-CoA carboxylase beta subunit